jgi:hypothetical protein
MKFNELLNRAAAVIPAYRQIVFKTIIIAFCAGGSPGRISNVFRKFALLFTGDATLKKFYNFLNSGKLPWDALWGFLAGVMGDPAVDGRLLIGLDDTTYGKTGKYPPGLCSPRNSVSIPRTWQDADPAQPVAENPEDGCRGQFACRHDAEAALWRGSGRMGEAGGGGGAIKPVPI